MYTHRGHTHERACASAHVITCLLIYGRFLLQFAVNILHKARATFFSCSRTMRTRGSARVRASARLNIPLSLDGLSSNVMTSSNMGYILIIFKHRLHTCVSVRVHACASARVIKRSLIFEQILSKLCGVIQQISSGYMSYLICVWMHILTARTSIHSRICQACDRQWLV
jgi:hypothetical protein